MIMSIPIIRLIVLMYGCWKYSAFRRNSLLPGSAAIFSRSPLRFLPLGRVSKAQPADPVKGANWSIGHLKP
jgi:hypothetical protein